MLNVRDWVGGSAVIRTATTVLSTAHHVVIAVRGELDLATGPALKQEAKTALHGMRMPKLVLDLSELTFMDSMGLSSVLGCHEWAREAGGQLVLVNPAPQVARLLKATAIDQRIPVFNSIHEAIA